MIYRKDVGGGYCCTIKYRIKTINIIMLKGKIRKKWKLRDVNEIYSNVSSNAVTHHQFYFVSNHRQNKWKNQIRMNHIFCVITMNINSYLRRNGFCMTYEYMGRSTQISNVIINPFLHGHQILKWNVTIKDRLLQGIKTDYYIPGHMSLNLENILENIEYV